MDIHKFTCTNNHVFFIPMHLPKPINEVVGMIRDIQCPLCHDKGIDIHAIKYKAEVKQV